MTDHTPGPWTVDPYSRSTQAVVAIGEGEVDGAFVDGPNAFANARLIASAPDLLAALKQARHAMMTVAAYAGDVETWNTGGEGYEAIEMAHAAIAKATQ